MIRKDWWIVMLLCVFIGFSVTGAFKSKNTRVELEDVTSVRKIEELLAQKKMLEERKSELLEKIREYEKNIASFEKAAAERSYMAQQIQEELENARLLAGLTDVRGPGVEIILNDRKKDSIIFKNSELLSAYIVHDSDLLNVINELRAAGAEAIAVNGERIIATSRISCGGPTINVGRFQRFTPPFIIHAIGDPEAIMNYFRRPDSIYYVLKFWGLEFKIRKMDNIEIPRYYGDVEYRYAKPVKEGE